MSVVYMLQCGPFIKLGFSTDFDTRLRQIRAACPYPITVVTTRAAEPEDEKELLAGAREWRLDGDAGGREWHEDCPELREYCRQFFAELENNEKERTEC